MRMYAKGIDGLDPSLVGIVEDEVRRALEEYCWKAKRILSEPCRN